MLEKLKLKEKGSLFHKYVYHHINIGQDDNHLDHMKYLSKYKDWKIYFSYSHGELDTQRKLNTSKISCVFNIKIKSQDDILKFVFAIDSFYLCLLMLCAAKKIDNNFSENKFKEYFSFSFFKKMKIGNYFLPSHTYLGIGDMAIYSSLFELTGRVKELQFTNSNLDLIREVFHEIYPREIRHSLGEFYTPDWMAQHIIGKHSIETQTGVIIDPTCGSGTFLICALKKLNSNNKSSDNIHRILGFDINPVSAFAAKTNVILNSDNTQIVGKILPVFCANILDYDRKEKQFKNYEDAIHRIKNINSNKNRTYNEQDISELEKISLQIPALSKDIASLVIGNPPWVNWEYLPSNYKEKYKQVWQNYGLFDYKGLSSIFIKEDISSLITYVTINHYLKMDGKISFIVKESLFKSIKQAAGFRKFYLKNSDTHFKVELLEDLTSFNPFNGVTNNTVIFHGVKGKKMEYPVDYIEWILKPKTRLKDTDGLAKAREIVLHNKRIAIPSNPKEITSGWASVNESIYRNMPKLTGVSAYKARTGVFTGGANGIYWLKILKQVSFTTSQVENITGRAKNKFEIVTAEIENDILYPYASGSDIQMWSFTYKKYVVCPHTVDTKMYPIPLAQLKTKFPHALSFFKLFEEGLKARRGFTSFDRKIHEAHFYTLQRIGDYTFAEYKVAWKYISSKFTCAVIHNINDKYLGKKTVIPNEKIIYIGLSNKNEAYYLCGLLSSTYFRELINSFKVSTQIAPSTINNLNLPKYDDKNPAHRLISSLCERGHQDLENINKYIAEIDENLIEAISADDHINKVALPASMGVQVELKL